MITPANQTKATPYKRVQFVCIQNLLGPRLKNSRNGFDMHVGRAWTDVTDNMTAYRNKIAQLRNTCRAQHVNGCVGNVDRVRSQELANGRSY